VILAVLNAVMNATPNFDRIKYDKVISSGIKKPKTSPFQKRTFNRLIK
jgi:hypothetical protein